jgi:Fe-S oxidoreductase
VNERAREIANRCSDCRLCLEECLLLATLDRTPGELARELLNDPEAAQGWLLSCSLCGLCAQVCPEGLSPMEMVLEARRTLADAGVLPRVESRPLLTDRRWTSFSLYRVTYGIDYADLPAGPSETVFFPGCALASFAPELVRAAFAWLAGQMPGVGFDLDCCHRPLEEQGLSARFHGALARLADKLRGQGTQRLITACPNCTRTLRDNLPGFEVVSLYELLSEAGLSVGRGLRLTVHDSCPARGLPELRQAVRSLLGAGSLLETAHHGLDAVCCGSGGGVSCVWPELCRQRAEWRMAEVCATGADLCVTYCMACAKRLASAGAPMRVIHCLELVFDLPQDYEALDLRLQAMWEGEAGARNEARLEEA